MLHPRNFGHLLVTLSKALAIIFIGLALAPSATLGQILVGNPFTHDYTGWVDAFPPPIRGGNWRLSLHSPALIDTNNANPPNTGATTNDGTYEPDVLIQNSFLAPANYELNATLRTNDDDLLGLVWNYQDPDNYFRVGFRQQLNSGNFGGTEGVSVQKVVGGVLTQLVPATPMAGVPAVDQTMIDNRTPFNVRVAVNGSNYEVFFNNTSVASGSDPDLASGRKVGVQSWAQAADDAAVTPFWGTEVESISVTQGATTLYSETFDRRPLQWRPVVMTNANGVSTLTTASREDIGNFGLDVNDPWILQHSNGFENATFGNVDFIGPGVVIDEPGSSAFSNYQMQVRIGTSDNDGIGVMVRAQDDNNFYRIVFTNEGTGTAGTRAPRGMSVQKVRNGVWSELYRDDSAPLFVYTPGAAGTNPATPGFPMFDLSVGAVGNSLKIQVRDQNGNVVNYPVITDNSDPILSGSVGLTTWGTDNVYYTGYAGQEGPLLTTLSAFTELDVVVDRGTGNITLTNNSASPVNIKGVSILSNGGGLNPATWLSVANNYDRPSAPTPGNGSVDPDDAWTITSSTATNLSEAEQAGNGGTLGVGQSVNFGNAWIKSRIEDVAIDVQLASGSVTTAAVSFSGGPTGTPYHRSDLNTDGAVNANDWPLFFPNLLTDMSAMTAVQQALKGDVDGDGDNDVVDFGLFKADFDAVNGAGAFEVMLASVPEPSAIVLLAAAGLAVVAFRRRRHGLSELASVAASVVTLSLMTGFATAAPVDFTTYTVEHYPHADSDGDPVTDFFPQAIWTVTPTSATHNNNADANVFYSPDSALNKRYMGLLTPGTDDDVVGFVLGFEPGDAQLFSSADYLLIDWKGLTQTFNFTDFGAVNFHHDQTPGGSMPVGLALSRVTGIPTADELWQHTSYDENPFGGVAELARGATLGAAPYNRAGGSHFFDIRYTPTNVTVLVDGVEQFNQNGSFPDGRFGLYTLAQGPPASYSNFEVVSSDFAGLSARVDRGTGEITLRNAGGSSVEFDYYQFDSASNSLDAVDWMSLSDQNFQSVGAGAHQRWQEAGGSDPSAIAEAYLAGMSTLAGGGEVSIGNAYNNLVNGEDLVLSFRLPSGLLLQGAVEYIGMPPIGLAGDFNGDGMVGNADLTLLLNNWGDAVPPVPAGWTGTQPTEPAVGNDELTSLLNTWGDTAPGQGAALGSTAVPEPATMGLVLCLAALLAARYRNAPRS